MESQDVLITVVRTRYCEKMRHIRCCETLFFRCCSSPKGLPSQPSTPLRWERLACGSFGLSTWTVGFWAKIRSVSQGLGQIGFRCKCRCLQLARGVPGPDGPPRPPAGRQSPAAPPAPRRAPAASAPGQRRGRLEPEAGRWLWGWGRSGEVTGSWGEGGWTPVKGGGHPPT